MTLPVLSESMPDTQSGADRRQVAISQAGISDYRLPVNIEDIDGTRISTVATFKAAIGLKATQRGAHMSRFVAALNHMVSDFRLADIQAYLRTLERLLESQSAFMQLDLPWFFSKTAPISGETAVSDVDVSYRAASQAGGSTTLRQRISVPVTSLCPCSKAISKYGAHNQRATISMDIRAQHPVPLKLLIRIAEQNASCEVFPALKRPDEKVVTERAYENAKFVEDIVRDTALSLKRLPGIESFQVRCSSIESIHNHNAYASVSGVLSS